MTEIAQRLKDMAQWYLACSRCSATWGSDNLFKDWAVKPLWGDDLFELVCAECSETSSAVLKRCNLSWTDAVHLVLYHLSQTRVPLKQTPERAYYHVREICRLVDEQWSNLWIKVRSSTWNYTIASCLSTNDRFVQGSLVFGNEQGYWGLKDNIPPLALLKKKAAGYLVSPNGTLIEPEESIKRKRKKMELAEGESDTDSTTGSPVKTKKGDSKKLKKPQLPVIKKPRKYVEMNRATAIQIYPDLDNLDMPVVMCADPTHSAPQMRVVGGRTVYTDKGYRLAKASHGIWEGVWYYEVTVEEHSGHLRLGWSQISGDLQAPCGYDQFSYSFRDSPGTLFHKSRKMDPQPPSYSQGFGDVMGVLIRLPPVTEMNRYELSRRMWNPAEMKDYLPIPSKPLEPLPDSEIRYYKNGVDLGAAFTDINFGKYYPAVSSYMGGKVTFNFGPKFKYVLPNGATPFCEAQLVSFWPRPEKSLPSEEEIVVEKKGDSLVKQEIKEEPNHMEVDPE